MNRQQRRKIQTKAEKIWKLEMLATLTKEESVKKQIEKDITEIAKSCSMEELLLIDEYLIEKYNVKT